MSDEITGENAEENRPVKSSKKEAVVSTKHEKRPNVHSVVVPRLLAKARTQETPFQTLS
jgi:hypothetical protein